MPFKKHRWPFWGINREKTSLPRKGMQILMERLHLKMNDSTHSIKADPRRGIFTYQNISHAIWVQSLSFKYFPGFSPFFCGCVKDAPIFIWLLRPFINSLWSKIDWLHHFNSRTMAYQTFFPYTSCSPFASFTTKVAGDPNCVSSVKKGHFKKNEYCYCMLLYSLMSLAHIKLNCIEFLLMFCSFRKHVFV